MSLIPSIFSGPRSAVFDPFSLDLFDPLEGLLTQPILNSPSANDAYQLANVRVDWKETPEAHVFKADLPGLTKEEVKVEVADGGVLQISGQRTKEQDDKTHRWHRSERTTGKFLRGFRLPENVKLEEVKAAMENGVLTVTVPKAEQAKPQVKSIDISG